MGFVIAAVVNLRFHSHWTGTGGRLETESLWRFWWKNVMLDDEHALNVGPGGSICWDESIYTCKDLS